MLENGAKIGEIDSTSRSSLLMVEYRYQHPECSETEKELYEIFLAAKLKLNGQDIKKHEANKIHYQLFAKYDRLIRLARSDFEKYKVYDIFSALEKAETYILDHLNDLDINILQDTFLNYHENDTTLSLNQALVAYNQWKENEKIFKPILASIRQDLDAEITRIRAEHSINGETKINKIETAYKIGLEYIQKNYAKIEIEKLQDTFFNYKDQNSLSLAQALDFDCHWKAIALMGRFFTGKDHSTSYTHVVKKNYTRNL